MKTSLLLFLLLPVWSCQADITQVHYRFINFKGTNYITVDEPFVSGATESIHLNASYTGLGLVINDVNVNADISLEEGSLTSVNFAPDFTVLPKLAAPITGKESFDNRAWKTKPKATVSFSTMTWTFAPTESVGSGGVPIDIEIIYTEVERNLPGNVPNVVFSVTSGPVPAPEPSQTAALAAILGVCVVVSTVRRLNKPGRH